LLAPGPLLVRRLSPTLRPLTFVEWTELVGADVGFHLLRRGIVSSRSVIAEPPGAKFVPALDVAIRLVAFGKLGGQRGLLLFGHPL
jgi:hypothetical protein